MPGHHDGVQSAEPLSVVTETFAHQPFDPVAGDRTSDPLLAQRQTKAAVRQAVVAYEHGEEAVTGAARGREDVLELFAFQ